MDPGELFEGRYRIIRELGEGGYATVYLAEHIQIEQRVAIKLLLEPGSDARFLREGKILARLTSPNTVRILDFGQTADGIGFMISEFIEGETLAKLVESGPFPVDDAIAVLEQILASLAEAHELGIIHRDIKPANVMRLPTGQVKVLDFGIARVAPTADADGLTAAGIVVGTPRYLAPEVLLSPERVQPSADVFAVGLMACLLVTGEEANSGLTSSQIIARHLSTDPYEIPPDVAAPRAFREWVQIATHKIAAERYPTAQIALEALQAVHPEPSPVVSAPPPPAVDTTPELQEIELDLGDRADAHIGLDRRVPARSRAPVEPVRRRAVTHKQMGWPTAFAVIVAVFVAVGLAAYATDNVPSALTRLAPDDRPPPEPAPEDPPYILAAYDAGKAAFDERQWIESLEYFQIVMGQPDTHAARDLARNGYTDRAIANVLEEAIDARESARSKTQMLAAAEAPRKVLELFPDHEATQEVLLSIADATPTSRPKRRKRNKVEIRGISR